MTKEIIKIEEMVSYEKFEELLKTKDYSHLSESERILVSHFIESEEEYQSIRKVLSSEDANRRLSPRENTLPNLHQHLSEKHSRSFKVSGYAASLIILLCSGLCYWLGAQNETVIQTPERVVQLPGRIDTLTIYEKPDTVFLTRVVYKEKAVYIEKESPITQTSYTEKENTSINMKENGDLNVLLVSGR
ncbi:hypothetical protein [Fulvivirga ligni]|uniref:hypothetical protein n=1 Tax=Fulvivirga ligni TaxID=2904246 RepID=UPI001F49201B|nr:hypothetical protein [Fulvivirga ligni]UII24389.1 hypothetical protein LVD16_15675 [Fulvivirga ligni]